MKNNLTLLWLRRDLRLHDHAALHTALSTGNQVQPVFVFDSDILRNFPNKDDRRLSFIASQLVTMQEHFKKRGGGLLVVHGSAASLIPALVRACGASHLIAAQDYEPETRKRDAAVTEKLHGIAQVQFVKDQLIFNPSEILKKDGSAYKVYTPYAKVWRSKLSKEALTPYTIKDKGCYADSARMHAAVKKAKLNVLRGSAGAMLGAIGYRYKDDALWPADDGPGRLERFISGHAKAYKKQRNFMGKEGTSRLSPYLRFGLISIREAALAAKKAKADTWLGELIWREFYAMILYHFPDSAKNEWNPKYRRALPWSHSEKHFTAWQEGKTGYPIVDAAMRQLLEEGWMHNRARMIVASFLTKHLRIDWRKGEAHFGQHLMDYELASNVGGWQWAASTGTDAQPYFRVFNPVLQSEKFDPNGEYIRRFVPELAKVDSTYIHAPWEHPAQAPYYLPVVDHKDARAAAITMFKTVAD